MKRFLSRIYTKLCRGSTISFWLARFLGRDFLYLLFDRHSIENYRSKINSGRGLLIVFLLYLVPGLPKDLVSYAAGISDMRFITFLTMSSVGRSPGMIGSLLFGHFFSRKNSKAIIILAIITAILVIMFIVFRKKILRMLDEFEARSATHKENSSNVQKGQN